MITTGKTENSQVDFDMDVFVNLPPSRQEVLADRGNRYMFDILSAISSSQQKTVIWRSAPKLFLSVLLA